jgi:hypothetical protein
MVHAEAQLSSSGEQRVRRALERQRSEPLSSILKRRGLGEYRGYAEMLTALRELEQRGARLDVIGDSVGGEPLIAVTIGNRDSKRTSAVLSGLHPMEWVGIETNLALLERLAQRPMSDRRIVAVPVANPDGVLEVERNLRRGRRRLVRFNRSGVDLNRNFPVHWNRLGLSRLMLGRHRPGSAPASEPEVRAITSFLTGSMVDRALSLHSFGGAVLYPYAGRVRAPLDVAEHRRWANHIAERADSRNPYRIVQCSHWLPGFTVPGMELDYFHDQHGAVSLLVECTRGGLGPRKLPLRRVLEPFAWYNPERLDNYAPQIASAVEPFVRGLVHP